MFERNQKFTVHLNKFSVVTFNDYVIHRNHTKLQSNENAFFSLPRFDYATKLTRAGKC